MFLVVLGLIFEDNRVMEIGERFGNIFGYFLFTSILFLVLTFFNKIPSSWGYYHLMRITIFIVLLGLILKRILK